MTTSLFCVASIGGKFNVRFYRLAFLFFSWGVCVRCAPRSKAGGSKVGDFYVFLCFLGEVLLGVTF